MLLFMVFLSGIANFASQKAVMESGHPFVQSVREHFGQVAGERLGLFLDYTILVAAMYIAAKGNWIMPTIYFSYTAFNLFAAYLIINRRV